VNHLTPTNTKLDVTTIQNGLTSLYIRYTNTYLVALRVPLAALAPGPPFGRGTPPAPGPPDATAQSLQLRL
jgi:hypothetical protein